MRSLPPVLLSTLLIGSLVACSDESTDDDPGAGQSVVTEALGDTVAKLALTSRIDAFGPRITAAITAPDDAVSMQIGLDPNFGDDDWQPLADSAELPAYEGYQEVFARFRSDDGTPSEFTVAGITIDSHAEAATASPPKPAAVGLIAPNAIEVSLEVGRVQRGVGRQGDTYLGDTVDATTLDRGWTLTGDDAPTLSVARRVSIPTDGGRDTNGEMTLFPMRHTVTLITSAPLVAGSTYAVGSPLGTSIEFTVDDRTQSSPAVHANQVGYDPADAKVAYYSVSEDVSKAAVAPEVRFAVVNQDGTEALRGIASSRTATDEAGKGDVTAAKVFQLDFSAVTTPGRYKVCVDTVGCSGAFDIDDSVWSALATTVARSLYYNRSGIELNAPFGSFVRPRPDHPDDGMVAYATDLTAFEASEQTDETVFDAIAEKATTTPVDDAWGGHFDAGDWDRRPQHLFMARQLLDIARRYPDAFADGSLNLPESGNGISDLADEALWTVDLFQRLQLPDGAVRGGIESERFPDWGTPSWNDTIPRYVYAPDAWSSWVYASVAADAALLLRDVDPERASKYERSAVAAWTWAESQETPQTEGDPSNAKVVSQRAVAAASLLELTGDAAYGSVFIDIAPFADGPTSPLACHSNEWCDAGWRYLAIPEQLTDPSVRTNIVASFTELANRIIDASEQTKFGWCLEDPGVPMVWGMGVGGNPHIITVLRAALLTDDQSLFNAAQRCAAVSLGANPTNTSFVTGRGQNPARHPLLSDSSFGGVPVWPGIPVYGTHPLADLSWVEDYRLKPAGSNVEGADVALLESWFDLPDVAALNEFTVFQSQAPVVWAATALAESAARRR
ncbi:MAG: hypothetical protein GX868_09880 [Actinobacteria bacterium]|nr:hypothetical protein [Actinomycetota bacterium]